MQTYLGCEIFPNAHILLNRVVEWVLGGGAKMQTYFLLYWVVGSESFLLHTYSLSIWGAEGEGGTEDKLMI
jgi:hypothetical protein